MQYKCPWNGRWHFVRTRGRLAVWRPINYSVFALRGAVGYLERKIHAYGSAYSIMHRNAYEIGRQKRVSQFLDFNVQSAAQFHLRGNRTFKTLPYQFCTQVFKPLVHSWLTILDTTQSTANKTRSRQQKQQPTNQTNKKSILSISQYWHFTYFEFAEIFFNKFTAQTY